MHSYSQLRWDQCNVKHEWSLLLRPTGSKLLTLTLVIYVSNWRTSTSSLDGRRGKYIKCYVCGRQHADECFFCVSVAGWRSGPIISTDLPFTRSASRVHAPCSIHALRTVVAAPSTRSAWPDRYAALFISSESLGEELRDPRWCPFGWPESHPKNLLSTVFSFCSAWGHLVTKDFSVSCSHLQLASLDHCGDGGRPSVFRSSHGLACHVGPAYCPLPPTNCLSPLLLCPALQKDSFCCPAPP